MVDFAKHVKKTTTRMPAHDIDLESDSNSNQPIKETDLRMVQQLADEMRGIESKIENHTKEIERLALRHQQIQLQALPDLMTQVGLSEFKLVTGEFISIRDFVRAGIPSQSAIDKADGPEKQALLDRKEQCFAWLRKNKADSLIKTELVASFGKGQSAVAKKLVDNIIKKGYPAYLDENVNFQTLNKFIRESLQNGVEVPVEPFALFTGKKAELTRPRAAKAAK